MTITRDNKKIELTPTEIRLAFDEYERDCHGDDLMGKLEEMVTKGDLPLSTEDYESMSDAELQIFEEEGCAALVSALGKNDGYWESFWATVENVVRDIAQSHKNLSYGALRNIFRKHEKLQASLPLDQRKHLTAHITFTENSFSKPYSREERTYVVSSDNKAYKPSNGGYSIYGSSLDGSDTCVRLEMYMREERGGKDGWEVEEIHLLRREDAAT